MQKLSVPRKGDLAMDMTEIIDVFAQIAGPSFAVAFVFGFGAKIVHSFLSMGLDGKFKL